MTQRRLSRRQFLRGLGGAAVSLPILGMGAPGPLDRAYAETGKFPKRFVFMIHPNGVIPQSWFPTGGEKDFVLGASHTPLQEFRDKLLLFKGVDMACGSVGPGEPHQKGMAGFLTGRPLQMGDFIGGDGSRAGWGDGVSLDQYLASKIGRTTPFGSLELGVRADGSGAGSEVRSRISYAGPGQPLPPQNDPGELFNLLFSDAMTEPDAVRKVRAQRRSVLDAVSKQFDAVVKRADSDDRRRLEIHAAMIRDIEQRLDREQITGDVCFIPDAPEDLEPDSEETMPKIMKAQLDLLAIAFACDLTRVATIQISNAKNYTRYPWLDSLGEGHNLSHAGPSNPTAVTELTARDAWHSEQLAYFMRKLAQVPEGDGTMLDNTVIVWTSEIAVGNTHSQLNMPILMAGSAGGYFKTGRFLTYQGKSHQDLLVSILHAFDVEDSKFGDERFCTGPLAGLTA
jgi:hypothetical protein